MEHLYGAVPGAAGVRTLRNLLATAMAPMGSTLYVYGGGWDLGDAGAGPEARRIGPSPAWGEFFRRQDAGYAYRDDGDPENRFYPRNGQNRFHWAGLDCSGYLGWTLYNTLHAEDGGPGYVLPAEKLAAALARRGWGGCTRTPEGFCPGDVCSLAGHVWLCVGTCGDGSVVLAHSTPSPSRLGRPGGGVQLSAVDPGEREGCAACRLARNCMERAFPEWSRRYAALRKDYAAYTDFSRGGRFRWALGGSGPLTDPEGMAALGAEAVLQALFGA